MKHLSPWRNERGATTTTTEMVPRQHSGSGSSIEVPVEKNTCDGSVSCEDGGVLPDTGFPHVGDKAKEGQRAPTIRTRGEQGCISYKMHSFVHGRRLGVIPSKCANGTVLVQCKVEEVDVLGTFGSGSRGT